MAVLRIRLAGGLAADGKMHRADWGRRAVAETSQKFCGRSQKEGQAPSIAPRGGGVPVVRAGLLGRPSRLDAPALKRRPSAAPRKNPRGV